MKVYYAELIDSAGDLAEVVRARDLIPLRQRIQFLEEQIRIEQAARKEEAAKYAIIEARYKQLEERWHKLMERRELQCSNRVDARSVIRSAPVAPQVGKRGLILDILSLM